MPFGENGFGFTPRSRKRLLVLLFGGPVGPPPPSKLFVVFPAQRMELGAIGQEGLAD